MMKRALIPLMIGVAGVATSQPKPAAPNRPPMTVTALPGVKLSEAVPAVGTSRIYYTTYKDELFMYDRTSRASTLVGRGVMREIALSPKNDRIAFGRGSEANARDLHIWTMPLDRATGAEAGPARRVSVSPGHAPQFSPDGEQIAFAAWDSTGKERVAIIPTSGGVERIADKTPWAVELIRWSPDGQTLYVGDWGMKGQRTVAYRVSIAGGATSLIAKTGSSYPGLSPDGRLIAITNEKWDSVVVLGSSGRRLGAFWWINGADVASWNGSARLFVPNGRPPYKLRAYSLVDGRTRALTDSTNDVSQPHWSRDGRRIAVFQRGGVLVVMNADGSGARAIAKISRFPTNCSWSPDGRWIAFTRWVSASASGGKWSLAAVEVATRREVTFGKPMIVPPAIGATMARWAPDSRSLFYTEFIDTIASSPLGSRYSLHEATLSGADRVLRVVTTYRGAASLPAFGDSTIELVTQKGAHVTYPIRSGSPGTTLMPEGDLGVSWPSFSSDGNWVAYRINPTAPFRTTTPGVTASNYPTLEVMKVDGSQRAKISMPFNVMGGAGNPVFLSGTRELLVAGQEKRGGEISFYRVSLDGTIGKKLLTIGSVAANPGPGIAFELSPDGKTLLYVSDEPPYSTFTDIDLSAFLKLAPSKKTP